MADPIIVLTWDAPIVQRACLTTVLRAGSKKVGHVDEYFHAAGHAWCHLDHKTLEGTHEECKAWLERTVLGHLNAEVATEPPMPTGQEKS